MPSHSVIKIKTSSSGSVTRIMWLSIALGMIVGAMGMTYVMTWILSTVR